jgi:poly(A) polymerase
MIFEAKTDPCILGAINGWGDVYGKTVTDDNARHPNEWKTHGYKTWRFVPDIGLLMWWETPDDGEKASVEDWLERKGYEVNLRTTMGQKLTFREVVKTQNGSKIRRYKNNVGKQVGPQIYVHKKYAHEVIPHDKLRVAAEVLKKVKPNFKFNSLMWNSETGEIRFDESADFDTAREPHVGQYVSISPDGKVREGRSNAIWHHKWLWVKDDYTGFNVDNARNWSILWLSKLPSTAKGTDSSFYSQLQQHGLGESIRLKSLIMEGNKDKSALEFLQKMIQSGPFKGKVFLAGGAVRDMVMGQDPKDLDVVVVGDGINGGMNFAIWLAQQMGNYKPDSNPVLFPTYGTAKVVLSGAHNGIDLAGMDVEAVASRKEKYTPGSRKPEVEGGSLEDDVLRRDFTVNSLVMDLSTGEILDVTGKGRDDIKKGILRTTSDPDVIFGQDALRMFRAIRFAAKYNWQLAPELVDGIKKNLNNLGNTSKERVRDELNKMLVTKNPRRAFELLRDTGLLPHVAKEFQQAVGMTQNKHHKEDVFSHILSVVQDTQPDLVKRLMALFHDIGKIATRSETPTGVHFYGHEDVGAEMAEKIMVALKYPNELINAVKIGVKNHMRLKQGGDDSIKLSDKALRKFKIELGDQLEHILDVIHADNIQHADASAMPNQINHVRERLKTLDIQVKKPSLPISGQDLIKIGLKQGPLFSKILSAVTEAWFENPSISKEDAMVIAKQVAQNDQT